MEPWNEHVDLSIEEMIAGRFDLQALDSFGFSLVHQVAGRALLLRRLLQHNIDVNVQMSSGQTALHFTSDANALKVLLEYNANPNLPDCENQLPLDTITKSESIKLYFSHGHRGDVPRERGWTTIHSHAANAHFDTLHLYRDLNCDMNLKTASGWTPFQLIVCAEESIKNPEAIEQIRELRTLEYPPELDCYEPLKELYQTVLFTDNFSACLNMIFNLFKDKNSLSENGVKFLLELILEAVWKMTIDKELDLVGLSGIISSTTTDIRLSYLILYRLSILIGTVFI